MGQKRDPKVQQFFPFLFFFSMLVLFLQQPGSAHLVMVLKIKSSKTAAIVCGFMGQCWNSNWQHVNSYIDCNPSRPTFEGRESTAVLSLQLQRYHLKIPQNKALSQECEKLVAARASLANQFYHRKCCLACRRWGGLWVGETELSLHPGWAPSIGLKDGVCLQLSISSLTPSYNTQLRVK